LQGFFFAPTTSNLKGKENPIFFFFLSKEMQKNKSVHPMEKQRRE
jgi:hypothetical protein